MNSLPFLYFSISHAEQEVHSSVDNSGGIKGADKINIMKESDENAINNFLERNVTPNTNRDGCQLGF
jgi:hypothetical protein